MPRRHYVKVRGKGTKEFGSDARNNSVGSGRVGQTKEAGVGAECGVAIIPLVDALARCS